MLCSSLVVPFMSGSKVLGRADVIAPLLGAFQDINEIGHNTKKLPSRIGSLKSATISNLLSGKLAFFPS